MSRHSWPLLLAALVVAGCGGSDETPNDALPTPTANTPEGQLVDIGGRSLYLECRGADDAEPTVILEAGLAGDTRTWSRVVPDLPDDVRVCAYDRANVGQSDAAPTPRSAQDVVDDLDALMDAAALEPPYVLVGFSFGGIFTQLYAAEHPEDVAGVVLVESNHPDEARQFEQHLTRQQIKEDRAAAEDNPEGLDIYGSFDEVQQAGSFPAVPLVVVTAVDAGGEWPPGWDPALFDRLRAEQQEDLAALAPGGTQISAEGSGHQVPGEAPTYVVDAIKQVLAAG